MQPPEFPCDTCLTFADPQDSSLLANVGDPALMDHILEVHRDVADMIIPRLQYLQRWQKRMDRAANWEANPLITAYEEAELQRIEREEHESEDEHEPWEADPVGLDTVIPAELPAHMMGFINWVDEVAIPHLVSENGGFRFSEALFTLICDVFWTGVYAERNRLLTEVES